MASFTSPSYIPQFSQFIPEVDLNLYGQTQQMYQQGILQKQQIYNQNVEKVRSWNQSVAGLNIIKDVDRNYLNQKMSEIKTQTSQMIKDGNADFTKQSLINSLGGLAASVYSDPIIQTGVMNTYKVNEFLANEKKLKEDGKWAVQNSDVAQDKLNQWLSDTTPGAKLGDLSVSPFVDVDKTVQDLYKEAHPDVSLVQSPDGTLNAYTMTETGMKSLDPIQVKAEISSLIQSRPDLLNQLNLNIRYNYKGVNSNKLYTDAYRGVESQKAQYTSYLDKLKASKTDAVGNPAQLAQIENQIKVYENEIRNIDQNWKGYQESYAKNPENFKYSIGLDNWLNSTASRIGYTETSKKIQSNPYWENAHKDLMDTLSLQLKQAEYNLSKDKFEYEKEKDTKTVSDEAIRMGVDNTGQPTIEQRYAEVQDKEAIMDQQMASALWALDPSPNNKYVNPPQASPDGGATVYSFKNPTAAKAYYNEQKDLWSNGKPVAMELSTSFDQLALQEKVLKEEKNMLLNAESEWDKVVATDPKLKSQVGSAKSTASFLRQNNLTMSSPIIKTGDGKDITVQDVADFMNATGNGAEGYERLADQLVTSGKMSRSKVDALKHAVKIGNMADNPIMGAIISSGMSLQGAFAASFSNYKDKLGYSNDERLLKTMTGVLGTKSNQEYSTAKKKFMDGYFKGKGYTQENVYTPITAGKPEQQRIWAQRLAPIINPVGTEKSPFSEDDRESINTMLSSKNLGGLNFGYSVDRQTGNVNLRISNSNVNNGQPIVSEPISPETAKDILQTNIQTSDPYEPYKRLLYNRSDASGTAQFGQTPEDAVKVGQVGKYNLKIGLKLYQNKVYPTLYVYQNADNNGNYTNTPSLVGVIPPTDRAGFSSVDAVFRNYIPRFRSDQVITTAITNPISVNNNTDN